MTDHHREEEAVALMEFKSVAGGIEALDAMIKKSSIKVIKAHPICPGKYMILIGGDVESVKESWKECKDGRDSLIINDIFLPHLDASVIPAMYGLNKETTIASLGIIESFSVAATILASDLAVKGAQISLLEIRLGNGLGGKGYFVFTGELADAEYALEQASSFLKEEGEFCCAKIIPSPHRELILNGTYW